MCVVCDAGRGRGGLHLTLQLLSLLQHWVENLHWWLQLHAGWPRQAEQVRAVLAAEEAAAHGRHLPQLGRLELGARSLQAKRCGWPGWAAALLQQVPCCELQQQQTASRRAAQWLSLCVRLLLAELWGVL